MHDLLSLRRLLAAGIMALGVGVALAPAAHALSRTGGEYNTMYAGLGIKGYDPVAYFTMVKPTVGLAEHSFDWKGVTWRFASKENRDRFAANPMQFAPQYGGFCSWGVAQGKLFDVDPVNGWKIVDGKLYVNFNKDILATWEKDIPGLLKKAEANWPTLNQ